MTDAGCAIKFVATGDPCCPDCDHIIPERKPK